MNTFIEYWTSICSGTYWMELVLAAIWVISFIYTVHLKGN